VPTPARPQPVYVNSFEATYSKYEFCVTLGVVTPTGTQNLFDVLMTPEGAKTLLKVLEHQVKRYEEAVRKIEEIKITVEKGKAVQQEKAIYH